MFLTKTIVQLFCLLSVWTEVTLCMKDIEEVQTIKIFEGSYTVGRTDITCCGINTFTSIKNGMADQKSSVAVHLSFLPADFAVFGEDGTITISSKYNVVFGTSTKTCLEATDESSTVAASPILVLLPLGHGSLPEEFEDLHFTTVLSDTFTTFGGFLAKLPLSTSTTNNKLEDCLAVSAENKALVKLIEDDNLVVTNSNLGKYFLYYPSRSQQKKPVPKAAKIYIKFTPSIEVNQQPNTSSNPLSVSKIKLPRQPRIDISIHRQGSDKELSSEKK